MIEALKTMRNSKTWFIETNLIDVCLIHTTIFYLILPILIFAFGWMKPILAGIFSLLVLWGSIQTLRHFEYRKYTINRQKIFFIIIVIVILAVWLLLSGIGEFGLQSGDFDGRNAIFHDLINHNWPVRYDYSVQPAMQNLFGQSGAMVYYFLFWLPAALVGKFFGWQIANLFLFSWSFVGLLLVVYLISRKVGRASVWIVVAFIFFSGMDIIFARYFNGGSSVINRSEPVGFLNSILMDILSTNQIEWWANLLFQYSSITTQLYNVFNQAIPAWIVTLLILNQSQRKSHIFIYSLLVLFAPLPFIGLFPFVLQKSISPGINWETWFANYNFEKQKIRTQLVSFFKENLSFQNVIVGGIVMIISFTFLYSNTGNHEYGFIWKFYPQIGNLVVLYITFCMVEFLILGLLIYKDNSDKGLLILTLILLLLVPIFKYGAWNDFSTRVSIPPLIILFVLMVKNIWLNGSGIHNLTFILRKSLIILILLVGSITPLHEIHRSVDVIITLQGSPAPQDKWLSFDYGGDTDKMETVSNYVISDPDGRLFFQVFGK